jgi:hypothetical protein
MAIAFLASCQPVAQNPRPTGGGYCEAYARDAVSQHRANLDRRCGYGPNARWQPNYNNHYRWCLSAPRASVAAEDAARRDRLRSCQRASSGPVGNSRRYCQGYAEKAVAQNKTNQRLRCGFGPNARWQSNQSNHYRWCLSAPRRSVAAEDEARSERLRSCQRQAGGTRPPSQQFCESYAKRAVAQNRTNLRRRCDFGPNARWRSSYDDHFRWCRNASRASAQTETRARRRSLDQCR